MFGNLAHRKGRKKAIVAVARRLLTVMVGLMHRGETYSADVISRTGRDVLLRNDPELRRAMEQESSRRTSGKRAQPQASG